MLHEINILLVEDNDVDVEILKRGLRRIGASGALVRACDGIEALEILTKDRQEQVLPRPYVILLDINMPRMNGLEFLKELRSIEDIRDARVFVFSTSDYQRDIDAAYRNDATGYIVKPDTSGELQETLRALHSFWGVCKHPSMSMG